jgi:glycerol-3-phosphate O-acyltransferase/dihydroxyacetone phosphate acyltransferase
VGSRLVRALARLLLGVFYRRLEVSGAEHVPVHGPLILVANHQNALVDPMILLVAVERRLRPVAKAPLFHHPLIGPCLRLAGAIPVHRRQEGGDDPTRNEAMFRTAAATLQAGGAILIFPEGVSQAVPTLMPLRTGTARLLLAAESAADSPLGVRLVPAGLVFHEPGTFRGGWALVVAGPPVETADCVLAYATEPDAAVRRLTDRLARAIRALMVEASDRRVLRLLAVAETIWREEAEGTADDPRTRAAWLTRASRAYRYLAAREPARVESLMREVESYARDLDRLGLTGSDLGRPPTWGAVARYVARESAALLVGLPLAVAGLVSHGAPYRLTGLVVGALRPSPDAEATYKLSAALVLYPVSWGLEAGLAWWLGGPWAALLFLTSLAPTGVLALTWWERLDRVRREARGFLRFLWHRDLREHLRARRRALAERLAALARAVPDSALAGGDG